MKRRHFLTALTAAGALLRPRSFAQAASAPADDRAYWLATLEKIATPVLAALSAGELKKRMPLENARDDYRKRTAMLEAGGRLICGIAPWLELGADDSAEGRLRGKFLALTRQAIAHAVDPDSPDYMAFTAEKGDQPLVDASLLGYALVRAPRQLRDQLDARTRGHLIAALAQTRTLKPGNNNHLLFASMIEIALLELGAAWKREPVERGLNAFKEWYVGDGFYSDGPAFAFDYYNSFIIHPYLLDIVEALQRQGQPTPLPLAGVRERARRYAVCLELLISPEGTIPPIGRSLTNRFSIIHLLALLAWKKQLPAPLSPPGVRSALTALMRRMLEPAGTFDENGWLRIGLAGHQPALAESYMNTGSLYGCALGFAPLGLPPADPFWSAPAEDWTAKKIWAGENVKADKKYRSLGWK
jgi:hypothetical protein